jgi:hypothetical protein
VSVFPVGDFVSLVLTVSLGAIIYFITVLWIDHSIRKDLKTLMDTMNFPLIP